MCQETNHRGESTIPGYSPVSACALEFARRTARHGVAVHASLAGINTLIELAGIKIAKSLGDANTLLIGILSLLRTGRKADRRYHQENEASQMHGMVPDSNY